LGESKENCRSCIKLILAVNSSISKFYKLKKACGKRRYGYTFQNLSTFYLPNTKPQRMNLNQVTLPAKDLSRSIAFYEKLGLQLIVDSPPRYARFLCPTGDSTLSLHLVEEEIKPGITLYFETEQLDETYEKLVAEGVLFDLPPTNQRWGWREAHLQDPDGNKLILFWAGEYRKNPPWRIPEKN